MQVPFCSRMLYVVMLYVVECHLAVEASAAAAILQRPACRPHCEHTSAIHMQQIQTCSSPYCHAGEHQHVDLHTLQQAVGFAKYAVSAYGAGLFENWPSLWPGRRDRCA